MSVAAEAEELGGDDAGDGCETSSEEEDTAEGRQFRAWEYWCQFSQTEKPNILDQDGVCIADDGGISDIDELMYGMQYFSASMVVGFSIANIFMITHADISALIGVEDVQSAGANSKFLLSKYLFKAVAGGKSGESFGIRLDNMVPLLEVIVLWCNIVLLLWKFICVGWSRVRPQAFGERHEYIRWTLVSDIGWVCLPQLSSFSAMRLLYYVTPSVVGTQAYVCAFFVSQHLEEAQNMKDRIRAVLPLFRYVLQTFFYLVVGFDAFLVKYRMAADYIEREEFNFASALGAFIFLFQILGVVNLSWFVRERLFIFIFGGEDGNVDREEKARWDCWNALMAKKIYDHFGFFKGSIVLLGFDDYDFQMLVLDDDQKDNKMMMKMSKSMAGESVSAHYPVTRPSVDLGMDFLKEPMLSPASELRKRVIEENTGKKQKVKEVSSRDKESFMQSLQQLNNLTKQLQAHVQVNARTASNVMFEKASSSSLEKPLL
eukprot:TRINITY_DN5779_c0_g1_i1.p1 TRINITY_DN5779_c0_g1~~TRINITY_DN5779_c0_g1_i1.p1  ORF type:complete len:488 (+),score=101.38 TRINITY_DN5779_c0_g1_i1:84-1547(+)